MENERHRWSYMTEKQLAKRLDKITKLEKLDCFMTIARERGNDFLLHKAKMRKSVIKYGSDQAIPIFEKPAQIIGTKTFRTKIRKSNIKKVEKIRSYERDIQLDF